MNKNRKNITKIAAFAFSLITVSMPCLNVLAATKTKVQTSTQTSTKADSNVPAILGKGAITIDVKTKEIIYEKDIDMKMYPASTTKLMTALLLAENKKKTDEVQYTQSAKSQPAFALSTDIMQAIKIGDTMSADDVMKAMLLFSANDSAYMAADAVAKDSDSFIKMMNDKAQKLGMKSTHFVTANGLHNSDHYTTPYNLSILGRAALSNAWVKEVSGTKKDTIKLSNGLAASVDNRNKILGKDGCIAGKTGYTSQAGKCLVALYERDGRQILGVVMKSIYDANDTSVYNDMEKIINYSYKAVPLVKYKKNTVIEQKEISYKPFVFFGHKKTIKVPLLLSEDATYYDNDVNKKEIKAEVTTENINPLKINPQTKAGTLTLKQRESSKTYTLYTNLHKSDILKANVGLYIVSTVILIAAIIVVIFIISKIKNGAGRRKRRRR